MGTRRAGRFALGAAVALLALSRAGAAEVECAVKLKDGLCSLEGMNRADRAIRKAVPGAYVRWIMPYCLMGVRVDEADVAEIVRLQEVAAATTGPLDARHRCAACRISAAGWRNWNAWVASHPAGAASTEAVRAASADGAESAEPACGTRADSRASVSGDPDLPSGPGGGMRIAGDPGDPRVRDFYATRRRGTPDLGRILVDMAAKPGNSDEEAMHAWIETNAPMGILHGAFFWDRDNPGDGRTFLFWFPERLGEPGRRTYRSDDRGDYDEDYYLDVDLGLASGALGYGSGGLGHGWFEGIISVMAHEMGHAMGLMHCYNGPATSFQAGNPWSWHAYPGVFNLNTVEGIPCDMAAQAFWHGARTELPGFHRHVCAYHRGQLGWWDRDVDGVPDYRESPVRIELDAPSAGPAGPEITGIARASGMPFESARWVLSDGAWRRELIVLDGWPTARIERVEYRVDGRSWLPVEIVEGGYGDRILKFRIPLGSLPPGRREIEARGVDEVGNVTAVLPSRFIGTPQARSPGRLPNAAPSAVFSVSPRVGSLATTFRFDAAGCGDLEDDTDRLEVRWDLDGDGAFDTPWRKGKTAFHKYTSQGGRSPRLEVRDSRGAVASGSLPIEVRPGNLPPRAFFTADRESVHGTDRPAFRFDASGCSDPDDPAGSLEVRWDLDGDGAFDTAWSRERTVSHVYDMSAFAVDGVRVPYRSRHHSETRVVRLEVRDAAGQVRSCRREVWANTWNVAPEIRDLWIEQEGRRVERVRADLPCRVVALLRDPDAEAGFPPEDAAYYIGPRSGDDPDLHVLDTLLDLGGDGVWDLQRPAGAKARVEHEIPAGSLAPGLRPATLAVIDMAGARAERTVGILAVGPDGNLPPRIERVESRVSSFDLLDEGGKRLFPTVTFHVKGKDREDAPGRLRFRWDFESDGTWDTGWTPERSARHAYEHDPGGEATVEVEDTGGLRARSRHPVPLGTLDPPAIAAQGGPGYALVTGFVPGEGILGFRLYRAGSPRGPFTLAAELAADAASLRDAPLPDGIACFYGATAVDRRGRESPLSAIAAAVPGPLPVPFLEATSEVSADGSGWRVRLRAAEGPPVAGLRVYRLEEGEAPRLICGAEGGILDASDADLGWGGRTFRYGIRSHDAYGNESGLGLSEAEVPAMLGLRLFGTFRQMSGQLQTSLSWQLLASRNAWSAEPLPAVSRVRVLRAHALPSDPLSGALYALVAEVPAGPWSETLGGLVNGEVYRYAVQAVSVDGVEGTLSDEAAHTVDLAPPARPVGLSAALSADGRTASLAWSANAEADLWRYRVYRRLEGSAIYVKLGETLAIQRSYVDTSLPRSAAWLYSVSAVDKVGNESPRSDEVRLAR